MCILIGIYIVYTIFYHILSISSCHFSSNFQTLESLRSWPHGSNVHLSHHASVPWSHHVPSNLPKSSSHTTSQWRIDPSCISGSTKPATHQFAGCYGLRIHWDWRFSSCFPFVNCMQGCQYHIRYHTITMCIQMLFGTSTPSQDWP